MLLSLLEALGKHVLKFVFLFFVIFLHHQAECSETKIPRCVRYFNCSGEDQLNKHTFDENSFISNNELKLIGSTSKQFFKQELFGFDLSEDVLSDPQTLQNLLAKARFVSQNFNVLHFYSIFSQLFPFFL